MLFSQLTVDLGVTTDWIRYGLIGALLLVAVFSFIIPVIRSMVNANAENVITTAKPGVSGTKLKRRDVDRSSDTPPPSGFAAHLAIIETAAPNATPEVWWQYAKAELTEAEVALAEAKLARRADTTA